jgi:hypothetical protein
MKDFFYLLVTLILTGFAIGIAYLQVTYGEAWFIAYLPLIIMFFCWGVVIADEYSNTQ